MKQLWEYSVEELAERCAIAECEIERLRAALQRIADDTSEQIVGSLNCRDIAWAALHPENVVRVIDQQLSSDKEIT